jgi:ABC-type Na+ efflux pump permease subunit
MKTGNLAFSLVLIALFAGLSLGVVLNEVISEPEIKEVPVVVEKIVETPVEVVVEVEKDLNSVLNSAVDFYLSEVREDLDKYQELDRVKVEDKWTIEVDEDLKTISFSVEYRVFDTLKDKRTNYCENVEVIYEVDEDTEYNVVSC